jgi:branched-chain amino acid aminotransferase
MASGLACIDGVLLPAGEASIPVADGGLIRGDGVFEVVRLYDGQPFALDDHLQRMQRSADGLRLALDVDALRADIATMLAARSDGDDLLRVLATRGGRRIALFEPLPESPAAFQLSCVTYSPVRVLDQIKSLSYAANMLASRIARERGFDDALLVTPHSRVLECPTSSFFGVIDGVLATAPLSEHVLDSITRRVVLEVADAREQAITVADLERLDEAFIASSVVEVAGVSRIDDHELDAPGPLTIEVAALVRALIGAAVGG